MSLTQPYRNPGHAFLSRHGPLQSEQDVLRYVDFLRQEAGLSDQPPIDLAHIYQHFGIPTPLRAPLDEQQGILVDSRTGIILIKEDDPIVRQRFTEGHELMELLFDAHYQSTTDSTPLNWSEQHKERLCDRGAADLLMPASSFLPQLNELGVSFNTGRTIAALYQTSLLATLLRMMQLAEGDYALVMWRSARKPTETRLQTALKPPKKLRIWWRTQTQDWSGGFIPKDKSIPQNSAIYQTYITGQPHNSKEMLYLGAEAILCQVETMPMQVGGSQRVLSLLHLVGEGSGE